MNPDAMIVDGSGYTDAQGLSVMPDYRDRLTVSDLIDLVAYLKNLGGLESDLPEDRPALFRCPAAGTSPEVRCEGPQQLAGEQVR